MAALKSDDKKEQPLEFAQFEFQVQDNNNQNDKPNGGDIKNIKQLSQINFKIAHNQNDDMYADTKEKYGCIEIFKQENDEQKALYEVLTAGRKNNLPQLLSLFVSDYSRYRIKQFYKQNYVDDKENEANSPSNQSKYSEDMWGKKSKIVDEIVNAPVNSGLPSLRATITSSVTTHSKRLCKLMRFDNILDIHKIDDSLGWFAQYIIHGIALIKNENWKPPCQLDIWIVPQKVGYEKKDEFDDNDDDLDTDPDDSSSDDDDDPDNPYPDNNQHEQPSMNTDDYDLSHIGQRIEGSIKEENRQKYHNFAKLKRRFMEKIKNETQNKRYCMIVRRNVAPSADTNNMDDTTFEDEEDKDNDNDKDEDDDDDSKNHREEIYMFKPTKYHEIPKHHIPEWGIQAALEDVLPQHKEKGPMAGKDAVDGYMFLLSLQKNEQNEIRAWLFNRHSFTRFYPNDIINVLPHLFVKNKQNTLTKSQYKTLQSWVKKYPIPDDKFDKFTQKEQL